MGKDQVMLTKCRKPIIIGYWWFTSIFIFHSTLVGCFKIAIFRQYHELKAGDYQSLKSSRRNQESNSGPNCPASQEINHYITRCSSTQCKPVRTCKLINWVFLFFKVHTYVSLRGSNYKQINAKCVIKTARGHPRQR